jgi:hypothetical protein
MLPSSSDWLATQYSAVINPIPFMTVMIMIAIIAGQFIDSYLLTKWKFLIQGRHFWLRCVGSTCVGALATSAISYASRFDSLPFWQVVDYITVSYFLKIVGVMIFAIPGVVIVHLLKRSEPQELLDVRVVNYNPFATN